MPRPSTSRQPRPRVRGAGAGSGLRAVRTTRPARPAGVPPARMAQRCVSGCSRPRKERPASAEGEEPGFPPALPEPDMDPGGPADHTVEQQPPRRTPVGGTGVGDAEVAQRDDEHGEPPASPCRHQAEARGHRGEIEQKQFGVGLIATQEDAARRRRPAPRWFPALRR